ncbi:MAG: trimethylamine methyltransferase family protein [Gammaproteobacteria bacterium]|nr:trimethylamine methyltransferase family protein [Gammaproteobacteria bacterium]
MTRSSRRRRATAAVEPAAAAVYQGGRYQPLSDHECEQIIDSSLEILQTIGIADVPDWLQGPMLENGASRRQDGRLTFARGDVEKALRRASHRVSLPGFDDNRGLDIGGGHVHIGTGGAAVQTLDSDSGEYRDSTLRDLYRMMRVLDRCEHVHYGIRPLVARDMPTAIDLDINTAYACLRATGKPIGVSFDNAAHVDEVTRMFDIALAHKQGFRKQPFCFGVIVHVVPPLKFAPEGVDIMRAAIDNGMPLQICSAGQAGATSPASLAGALAQGLAESLAGLMVVDAIKPGHPCIYAFMPFISDLRTGAMSGGGGESAVANAAAAQLLRKLDLPATVSAGMTDSKLEDAQAGYEKGYSIALAANAGADMINLSVGMLGSIMVASPEALVIDDDMCGAILRTVRGIEIDADALDLDAIERVVCGDGHYLGEALTLRLMKTEYVYPEVGDRQSLPDWIDAGSPPIWERARRIVGDILQDHQPTQLSNKADRAIREKFNIRLEISEDNK